MAFDLQSIQKALLSLDSSIKIAQKKNVAVGVEPAEIEVIRAGVIQNFEFSYELCWKFMKRFLEKSLGKSSVDGISRKELFRLAFENKLITDPTPWFLFHEGRNQTSHTYDFETAVDVYQIALAFLPEAQALLKQLELKND